MKIVSVLRATPGLDEFPIYRALLGKDPNLLNFDDRIYGFHAVPNRLAWIERRANRNVYAKALNADLQHHITASQPDLLVVFKGAHLREDTVRLAREVGAKVVMIYPDLDPRIHGDGYLKALCAADIFYFTKPNLVQFFCSVVRSDARLITPLFSRHDVEEPQAADAQLGVVFVGHHSPGKARSLADFAARDGHRMTVFGEGWQPLAGIASMSHVHFRPPLYGAAVRRAIRAALCNLGLLMEPLSPTSAGDEITSRSILVPTYGGLLLHPRTAAAQALYGEHSPWLYDTLNDARTTVDRLRADPRLRTAWTLDQQHAVTSRATCAESLVATWTEMP